MGDRTKLVNNSVGRHIKLLRETIGMTQGELGKKVNKGESTVRMWELGKSEPDNETLKILADLFNVTTDYLLGRDEKSPLPKQGGRGVKIPVYGEIAAGIPIEAIEDIIDFEEITPEMAASGEYIALSVKGDSMAPRILEGDVVIIRRQETIESGEVAAVMVNGDSATLKRVRYADNGLWLLGNNPSFQPIFYSKEECTSLPVRILGKMVEFRGKS